MAIKKSDLYRKLWASCDALRGGMDASQYKDYVLVLLFVKYISDKYAGLKFSSIKVPKGASFADMVAFKGRPDIGERINMQIMVPLEQANHLQRLPDFNDPQRLGDGKERTDRLTKLISIFEDPALDFRNQRADGDDLLGDAYEYLMRHFATESGKSKGQFYTPTEVSRLLAQVLNIDPAKATSSTTVYDPTCGSGSLLLKVADQMEGTQPTLYGQEKDISTANLASMNMVLHNVPTATISAGNTLTNPKYKAPDGGLKRFDYVVANPPFSDKAWTTGLTPERDPYDRFAWGIPPEKNGDLAYLLHIYRSLTSQGRAAVILPHGVLFRGNAEGAIRQRLITEGIIEGIIGLPPNLFYGTGIPACVLVLDRQHAANRKGIFMVEASRGFRKEGPKNRLRERDLHRMVAVYTQRTEVPGYSRMVSHAELATNDYNLNLPRYLSAPRAALPHNLEAHLHGGLPAADLERWAEQWRTWPGLRATLLAAKPLRPGFHALAVAPEALRETITQHPDYQGYQQRLAETWRQWREEAARALKALDPNEAWSPKAVVREQAESLLAHYGPTPLLDAYAVYQHAMDYAADTWLDDLYLIRAQGWAADVYRITTVNKKGKEVDKGWASDLLPKELVARRHFAPQVAQIAELSQQVESYEARKEELETTHREPEDGLLSDWDSLTKASAKAYLSAERKKGKALPQAAKLAPEVSELSTEAEVLTAWLQADEALSQAKKGLKAAEQALDEALWKLYPQLGPEQVQMLVVEDKWLDTLEAAITTEGERVGQRFAEELTALALRYATPLPQLAQQVAELEAKVQAHLSQLTEA